MRRAIAAILLAGAVVGGAYYWHRQLRAEPEPAEELFRVALPGWIVERARDSIEVDKAAAELFAKADRWPKLRQRLEAIDAVWPEVEPVEAASAALNQTARESGLAYWVDVQVVRKQPILMTYRILGRARWAAGDASVEVLRVKRLDNLNIEMGLGGHAGGDLPVVLVDRVEESVMGELDAAFASEPRGNAVDQLARSRWRAAAGSLAGGDELRKAVHRLQRRERLLGSLINRLNDGRLLLDPPAGFAWGDAFFERLEPYADRSRRGGPLILASDLRELRRADVALRAGESRAALDKVLEHELLRIEAHEARHALDTRPLPVPPRLLEIAGEDDMEFAAASERELRAFFGELVDGPAPRCTSLLAIGRGVAGRHARLTPHHFAGAALVEQLDGGNIQDLAIDEALARLCALPEAELEARVLGAYEHFYGAPFVRARRAPIPLLPKDVR
ncbi:MAG: hypothetical protein ACOX6T_09200 [Myxococcales bacterium]|jgi:hypothetical protein